MASPDELRTRETSDEHLPGYAELYAELAPANPDPDTLSHVLQQRAAELGLPAAAGRGVPRALRPLVDILSRRHLVDDLGAYDATVTWLELHVPHGGSGAIKWLTAGALRSLRDDDQSLRDLQFILSARRRVRLAQGFDEDDYDVMALELRDRLYPEFGDEFRA